MPGRQDHQSQGLAEIAESAATGSVATLYSDIRSALGVDLVNLVYRHLATVPGALEWAWANLGPHFRSGKIDAQAALLRERIWQAVDAWPKDFQFGAVNSSDFDGAAQLANVYNLNNSRNLIAFRHLLDPSCVPMIQAKDSQQGALAASCPAVQLPAIPSWEEIKAVDRETVLRLNSLGEPDETGSPAIVASLYRHLAVWPTLLADVEPGLVQINSRGEIARALTFTVESSRTIASLYPLPMPEPAPPAVDEALRIRLRAFVDVTIPKMVPVGLALEAAFTIPKPS